MTVLRLTIDGRALFWCPGCECYHGPIVSGFSHPRWEWNGNMDKPTFSPSILVRWQRPPSNEQADKILAGEQVELENIVCHSFVRDGMIQFLNDCTHKLVGQTVALEEDDKQKDDA